MENKIRLVWDFRGADALKTAEHQLTHLVEFMIKENISCLDKSLEQISELQSICWIIIKESDLDFVKKRLKPDRGFLVN
ncbi:MAG: hypothetical protein CMD21_00610 [Flavobacteriales bacterium]|nr:hypothetical protein [Flavobacteriales bacterium]